MSTENQTGVAPVIGTLDWVATKSTGHKASVPDNAWAAGAAAAKSQQQLNVAWIEATKYGNLVGEYHHSDNSGHRFRMPRPASPSKKGVYSTASSANVLVFTPNSDQSAPGYSLEWVDFTGELPLNALSVAASSNGNNLYVARAAITSHGVNTATNVNVATASAYAIGSYSVPVPGSAGEPVVCIPFKSDWFSPACFQLLVAVPHNAPKPEAAPSYVAERAFFCALARASSGGSSHYANYVDYAGLSQLRYFASAKMPTCSLTAVDEVPTDAQLASNNKQYLNVGCVGLGKPDGVTQAPIVSFRGTRPIVADWVNDFMAAQVPVTINGYEVGVHAGFYYATKSILEPIVTVLREMINESEYSTVYVAGHSKGGGMATIAAALLKATFPNVTFRLMTFGSPLAGNEAFASLIDVLVPDAVHWIFQADPVPHVPFTGELDTTLQYYFNLGSAPDITTAPAISDSGSGSGSAKSKGFWNKTFDFLVPALVGGIFVDGPGDDRLWSWQLTEAQITEFAGGLAALSSVAEKVDGSTPEARIEAMLQGACALQDTLTVIQDVVAIFEEDPNAPTTKELFSTPLTSEMTLLFLTVLFTYVPGVEEWFEQHAKPVGDNQAYTTFMNEVPTNLRTFLNHLGAVAGGSTLQALDSHYQRCGKVQYVVGTGSSERIFNHMSGLVTLWEMGKSFGKGHTSMINCHGYYKHWIPATGHPGTSAS